PIQTKRMTSSPPTAPISALYQAPTATRSGESPYLGGSVEVSASGRPSPREIAQFSTQFSASPRPEGCSPLTETLARNLALLIQTPPDAARAIAACTPPAPLELYSTRDAVPVGVLTTTTNGKAVQRRLCSFYNPLDEANIFAEHIDPHTTGCAV